MADTPALARSPLPPAPPTTIVAGWEVSCVTTPATLKLADLTPCSKVLVRAEPAGPLSLLLGCAMGQARRAAGHLAARLGPDEWITVGPPGASAALVASFETATGGGFATCVDVTHLSVLLRLAGTASARLLEKLCAVDLGEVVTPNGSAFRSSLANVHATVVRDDLDAVRSYLILSDRSSGQYLYDALLDAGAEHGIGVSGYPGGDGFSAPLG